MVTKIYTTREAQEVLGVGKTTLWNLISNGELKTFRLKRHHRIHESELNDFIERQMNGGGPDGSRKD